MIWIWIAGALFMLGVYIAWIAQIRLKQDKKENDELMAICDEIESHPLYRSGMSLQFTASDDLYPKPEEFAKIASSATEKGMPEPYAEVLIEEYADGHFETAIAALAQYISFQVTQDKFIINHED